MSSNHDADRHEALDHTIHRHVPIAPNISTNVTTATTATTTTAKTTTTTTTATAG